MGGGTDKLGGIKDEVVSIVEGGCHFPSCISIFVDRGERDLLGDLDCNGGFESSASLDSNLVPGVSFFATGLLFDEELVRWRFL